MVNGQQAFGKAVLEALLERGDEVVGVYCGPTRRAGRLDPFKELALEKGLPVFQPASFRKPERRLGRDGRAQARSGSHGLRHALRARSVRDLPTHGTIQYHPSLLPLHRGPSSINWPIIMGETKTGLSIFYPDDGLDEGPILMQKEVAIEPDDTLGSVYFNKLFPLGVAAMLEAVDLVKAGNPPRIEQDHSQATYESWCKKEDAEIDWSKPVGRGLQPDPRHQPATGRLDHPRRRTAADLRLPAPRRAGDGAPGEVMEVSEGRANQGRGRRRPDHGQAGSPGGPGQGQPAIESGLDQRCAIGVKRS